MAIAIWDSAAQLRPQACFHSSSGIVGDWEEWIFLKNSTPVEIAETSQASEKAYR